MKISNLWRKQKQKISSSSSVDVKPTKYMCCRSMRRKLFWKIGEVTYGGQILVTRIPSISLKRRRSTSKQVSLNVAKMCTTEVPCIWEPLQGSSFKELNRNPILKMRQGIFRRGEEGSFLQCLLSNTLLQISCTCIAHGGLIYATTYSSRIATFLQDAATRHEPATVTHSRREW